MTHDDDENEMNYRLFRESWSWGDTRFISMRFQQFVRWLKMFSFCFAFISMFGGAWYGDYSLHFVGENIVESFKFNALHHMVMFNGISI